MRLRTRAGFTLVELMVAMALTMFIMVILSQAFVIALDTFVGLKAIGDMQSNLRTGRTILIDDLSQDHFQGDLRMAAVVAQPPRGGFFAVLQASGVVNATVASPNSGRYVREGTDATGFPSFRATNHVLYMTVKRKGNQPSSFFSTALPAASPFFTVQTSYTMNPSDLGPATFASTGFFSSQWAEVIYFLVQTGSTEEPNNPSSVLGMPLFSLMRGQFVMVTEGKNLANLIPNGSELTTFQGVSCNPGAGGALNFNSPSHAANAAAATPGRVIPSPTALVGPSGGNIVVPQRVLNGATLVLPNVTSFHVQVMQNGGTGFGDLPGANSGPTIYDTWTPTVGLKGIQVTLRVFEFKTRQTRQTTIVQDL